MANAWLLKPLPIIGASSPTVGSALGDFMNVGNDYAGVVWQSANALYANGAIVLQLGLAGDQLIDTIMLFGVAGAPDTASVSISAVPVAGGNFEGSVYNGPAQPLYAGSERGTSGLGVAVLTLPAAKFHIVRLTFTGLSAAHFVRISRAVIGKRIQLERNFAVGGSFGVRDLGSVDFSARGVLLRRRGAKLRTVALTFSNVRKDEVEAVTQPLIEQIGNTEMVALLTNPDADPQREKRAYFGPLVGDLGHTWRTAAAFEAKINLVSIF
jgi:hypothetical protein